MFYALTPRIVGQILCQEAIVQEAYKDSVGVWTWAGGVTSASGHKVERYIDNPQPMDKCLTVTAWLMRTKYLPHVQQAFGGRPLKEHEIAGALAFDWNTGKLLSASWVRLWLAGDIAGARAAYLAWNKPAAIMARRRRDADLFFDGKWTFDGRLLVYSVDRATHRPAWSTGRKVTLNEAIGRALANA